MIIHAGWLARSTSSPACSPTCGARAGRRSRGNFVPLTEGQVIDAGEFKIDCFPVRHRDTDSFGFSFQSHARRYLRPDCLGALGVLDGPTRGELAEVKICRDRWRKDDRSGGCAGIAKRRHEARGDRRHRDDRGPFQIRGRRRRAGDRGDVPRSRRLDRSDYGHLTAAEVVSLAAANNVRQPVLTHLSGIAIGTKRYRPKRHSAFSNSRIAADFDHIVGWSQRLFPARSSSTTSRQA